MPLRCGDVALAIICKEIDAISHLRRANAHMQEFPLISARDAVPADLTRTRGEWRPRSTGPLSVCTKPIPRWRVWFHSLVFASLPWYRLSCSTSRPYSSNLLQLAVLYPGQPGRIRSIGCRDAHL